MKPLFSNQRNHAFTLVELLLVIVALCLLAVVIWPMLVPHRIRTSRIGCLNNLRQVGLAYRSWEGDNNDKYPMQVSVTADGSMEMAATGNVVQTFLVMSNELSTPKILYCWEDMAHFQTNSFVSLTSSNISYFVGVDVTNELNPQMILSGDANLEFNGIPVKLGLLKLLQNSPIAWTSGRHMTDQHQFLLPVHNRPIGNIGLADGSAQQVTTDGLQSAFLQTSLATNRLAIP